MIGRRAAAGLAVLAVCAGCSDDPEPVPVPEDFSAAVTSLLRSVDAAADPRFGAETCGARPATADQIISWADATLTGVGAAELRTAAIAAGWQPQQADGVDLALLGPRQVRLALTGTTVRAERPKCTRPVDSRTLDDDDFTKPDPTDAQVRTAEEGQTRATEVAQELIGRTSPGGEAPTLVNCDGAEAGVTWTLRQVDSLTGGPDAAELVTRMADRLGPEWTTETTTRGPNEVLTGVNRADGLSVRVTIRRGPDKTGPDQLNLDIQPDKCIPVGGP